MESGPTPSVKLDDLVEAVDFIKVDCEGTDRFVLTGAEKLIERCHPKILMEQSPGDFLTKRGYKMRWESKNGGQGPTEL